jgi:hypothetical protein
MYENKEKSRAIISLYFSLKFCMKNEINLHFNNKKKNNISMRKLEEIIFHTENF